MQANQLPKNPLSRTYTAHNWRPAITRFSEFLKQGDQTAIAAAAGVSVGTVHNAVKYPEQLSDFMAWKIARTMQARILFNTEVEEREAAFFEKVKKDTALPSYEQYLHDTDMNRIDAIRYGRNE